MSFDETEKLFQGIPLSQIGFGTCLIILGGCQNYSGSFLEFFEIKTGNVPELPEPLQMRFADENHYNGIVPERVENYYGGYWKCSKPT